MHIVLFNPEIPHNTGAIGRVCVGLDWPLHLIRPIGFSLDERHLLRAGMDYWPHLKLGVHDSWERFLEGVKPDRLHFLSTKGEKTLYKTAFGVNDALIFGSESRGLPAAFYARYRDDLLTIPMPGKHARSINLANSVSIAAYEAWRQLNTGIAP